MDGVCDGAQTAGVERDALEVFEARDDKVERCGAHAADVGSDAEDDVGQGIGVEAVECGLPGCEGHLGAVNGAVNGAGGGLRRPCAPEVEESTAQDGFAGAAIREGQQGGCLVRVLGGVRCGGGEVEDGACEGASGVEGGLGRPSLRGGAFAKYAHSV